MGRSASTGGNCCGSGIGLNRHSSTSLVRGAITVVISIAVTFVASLAAVVSTQAPASATTTDVPPPFKFDRGVYPDATAYNDLTYNNDGNGNEIEHTDWMKHLDPNRRLSQLSIPGTHDSGTFTFDDGIFDPDAQTQSMDFTHQLDAGLRYFDVRVGILSSGAPPVGGCSNTQVHLFHSYYCLGLYQDALQQIGTFLLAHPSEFVVMSLTNSSKATTPDLAFKTCALTRNWLTTPGFLPGLQPGNSLVYDAPYEINPATQNLMFNPKVSAMAGKVVLMTDFIPDGGTFGTSSCHFSDFATTYNNNPDNCQPSDSPPVVPPMNPCDKEDNNEVTILSDVAYKWWMTKDHLTTAATNGNGHADPNTLYFTGLNASNGAYPCTFASGTALPCGIHNGYYPTGLQYGEFGPFDGSCRLDACETMVEQGLYQTYTCDYAGANGCSVSYVGLNQMAEAYIQGSDPNGSPLPVCSGTPGCNQPDGSYFGDPGCQCKVRDWRSPAFPGITTRSGIVMMDYPGNGLIQAIINVNFTPQWHIAIVATTADGQLYAEGSDNGNTKYIASPWTNQPVYIHYVCANLTAKLSCPLDPPAPIFDGPQPGYTGFRESWLEEAVLHDPSGTFDDAVATLKINIDTSPPTASPTLTNADGTPYAGGWTNQDVTIHWNWTDTGGYDYGVLIPGNVLNSPPPAGVSGIDPVNCPATTVVSAEGINGYIDGVHGTCRDNAGNLGDSSVGFVLLDKTAPTVTYTGNLGTYNLDQTVSITCAAADTLSDIASTTCQNITGPAYNFPVGPNTFSASATDIAGNVGTGSTTFTVNAAALTITAADRTTTYGHGFPPITASYTGLVDGYGGPATAPTCSADIPAIDLTSNGNPVPGTYTTSCSGASDPHYAISYQPGTLTVTPAPLTIRAKAVITYGQSVPLLTASYIGLANGDRGPATPPTCSADIPAVDLASNGNPQTGIYDTSCSRASDPNYAISYLPGTLTVHPAPLTVTANNKKKEYSDPMPVLNATISGFQNGDTAAVLGSAVKCTTLATPSSPAGKYAINCSIAASSAKNYALVFVPGTLTVSPEAATLQYTGELIAPIRARLNLRAQVSGNGDITKAWIEFEVYPSASCSVGTPNKLFAGTRSVGLHTGVATATFASSNPAAHCVIAKLVAGSTGGVSLFYQAHAARALITFYQHTHQIVNGLGWITDPNTHGRGTFGFNASYATSGTATGALLYHYRSVYHGVLADFIIRSDAITALTFDGSTYPIAATLQGKGTIQVKQASNGALLYSDQRATFTARATDTGTAGKVGPDTFGLTVYSRNGALYATVANSKLAEGVITVQNLK
jgi:hypothetical protein